MFSPGIKPKNAKWTMEDCQFFQNLVCKKSLVSILISTEKDELYRSDTVLNLKLIDTSTDQDVHIDRVLVQRGIAVDCWVVLLSSFTLIVFIRNFEATWNYCNDFSSSANGKIHNKTECGSKCFSIAFHKFRAFVWSNCVEKQYFYS